MMERSEIEGSNLNHFKVNSMDNNLQCPWTHLDVIIMQKVVKFCLNFFVTKLDSDLLIFGRLIAILGSYFRIYMPEYVIILAKMQLGAS